MPPPRASLRRSRAFHHLSAAAGEEAMDSSNPNPPPTTYLDPETPQPSPTGTACAESSGSANHFLPGLIPLASSVPSRNSRPTHMTARWGTQPFPCQPPVDESMEGGPSPPVSSPPLAALSLAPNPNQEHEVELPLKHVSPLAYSNREDAREAQRRSEELRFRGVCVSQNADYEATEWETTCVRVKFWGPPIGTMAFASGALGARATKRSLAQFARRSALSAGLEEKGPARPQKKAKVEVALKLLTDRVSKLEAENEQK